MTVAKSRMSPARSLQAIRLLHTAAWAIFVSCIFGIWLGAWRGAFPQAWLLTGIVCVEALVLILNDWRCPLTSLAARYTDDRSDNFDIYIPAWLARHNQRIFGALYLAGVLFLLGRWSQGSP